MAQSRPPPVRTHSVSTTPPPLSPRTPSEKHAEKKQHARKKSGKDFHVVSEKKLRPAPLSRRSTPQYVTKAAGWSTPRHGARERDRERDEEGGRDSGESFPQFCMSCEKQFLPANNTFLYCSESCRLHDQAPTQRAQDHYSPPQSPYTRHLSHIYSPDEGPDIIPRFSPTQSRPRSYFNSEPYPSSYHPPSSTPAAQLTSNSRSSTALASLRSLAVALPTSPRKDSASSASTENSPPSTTGVWNYMPFTSSSSKSAKTTPSVTPGSSYTTQGYTATQGFAVSTSYGQYSVNGGRKDEYSKSYGVAGYGSTGGMGMDRPLPPRSGPGGYGHRTASVDLVTPFPGAC